MGHAIIPLIRTSEVMVIADLIAGHVGRETLDLVFSEHGFYQSVFSGPSTTIANAEYVSFLEACARVAGRPLLGAETGNALAFEMIGLYGRYVTSAGTLREALARAVRTLIYNESGSALHVEAVQNQLFPAVALRPRKPTTGRWGHCINY
jgi:hypothetical protein